MPFYSVLNIPLPSFCWNIFKSSLFLVVPYLKPCHAPDVLVTSGHASATFTCHHGRRRYPTRQHNKRDENVVILTDVVKLDFK